MHIWVEWNQQQRTDDAASCESQNRGNQGWNEISPGSDWVSIFPERTSKPNKIDTELAIFTIQIYATARETRNHSLIDNMHKKLAQTHKKINDVKRKCTEATKHCLQMQFENVSFFNGKSLCFFTQRSRETWQAVGKRVGGDVMQKSGGKFSRMFQTIYIRKCKYWRRKLGRGCEWVRVCF